MLIKVKGFLNLREIIGERGVLELSLEGATLRELLDRLSQDYGDSFYRLLFDPKTGQLRPENPILVNGKHYRNLTDSLDTKLQEGDHVAIFPPVAGG